MSAVEGQGGAAGGSTSEPPDLKLEAVVIPVADADRSKLFYAGLGWRLDADFSFENVFGSCSSHHRDRSVPCSSAHTSPLRPRIRSRSVFDRLRYRSRAR